MTHLGTRMCSNDVSEILMRIESLRYKNKTTRPSDDAFCALRDHLVQYVGDRLA